MVQATATITPIRRIAPKANPLDTAIHNAGRKLCSLQMTRLIEVGCPTKDEAQSLVRDLLDIARIVDEAVFEIGQCAHHHFGNEVTTSYFCDQLLGALEGNATFVICEAAEARAEELHEFMAEKWRHGFVRQAAE